MVRIFEFFVGDCFFVVLLEQLDCLMRYLDAKEYLKVFAYFL